MERVLNTEPWSVDKHLMVLHRYDKEVDVLDIDFNMVTFWTQVHNIPACFRTRAVAEKICGVAGLVDKNMDEREIMGDSFIRVWVKVDISKPFCRGQVISLENGKYERQSNLCHWCGSLTHDERDCKLWIESEGMLPTEAQQYGAWIRAPPFVQSKRNSVSVLGFYKTKFIGPTTMSTPKSSAKPQVVIRRGGPAPKIVRSGQGSETSNREGIKFPDFQKANPMESSPFHTNHNDLGEINAINTDLNKGSLFAELFEEKLEEIDRNLRKFDAATEFHSKSNSPMGKENNLDSMTINEIFLRST